MAYLSIIVPVYNTFHSLTHCVESILNQTWQDFELILVDDGSPDNAGLLCEKFALQDSRIRVIHQSNQGLSAARNSGIRAATSKFYLFVDSDDYLAKHCCETLVSAQQQTNADLVIGSYTNVYSHTQRKCSFGNHFYKNMFELEEDYSSLTLKYCYSCVWGKLYRAVLFDEFDESCYFGEDVELNMRYLPRCKTIQIVAECLYYYTHLNRSAMTSRFDEKKFSYALQVYKLRTEFSSQHFSSGYVPRAENALLVGDTIRTIQRLILLGEKTYKKERQQISAWLCHPKIRIAVRDMYRSQFVYFIIWLFVRLRLTVLLQLGFHFQKALRRMNY